MIVKALTGDVNNNIKQLRDNINKNYPNAVLTISKKYNGDFFDIYREEINPNCYVRYVISANKSNRIYMKYIDDDINNDRLDSLLETLTYQRVI